MGVRRQYGYGDVPMLPAENQRRRLTHASFYFQSGGAGKTPYPHNPNHGVMSSFSPKDLEDTLERTDTGFKQQIADTTTNRLDLSSTYPPNTTRHKLTVNGVEDRNFTNTAFTNQPGKWQLTASDGDTVSFGSRELFRYVPNYEVLFGAVAWYNSTQVDGQHLYVELSDDARENVYRYDLTPGERSLELISGGTTVGSVPESEWGEQPNTSKYDHNPYSNPEIGPQSPVNPRGRVTWYGAGRFAADLAYTRDSSQQYNPTVGHLANSGDILTEEINLRVRVVADADPGAPEFTVNLGSMGALIRGNATEVDRPKAATFFELGGSIGPSFAGNAPVLAKRINPNKDNVAVSVLPPELSPAGDTTVNLLVGVVGAGETDASGWATARQGQAQNTAVQYTTNVSTFPTVTRTVPDGSSVAVPDVRQVVEVVAEGTKNSASKAEAGTGEVQKRLLGEDEVALYIPRSGGSTGVSLNWLRATNAQNW